MALKNALFYMIKLKLDFYDIQHKVFSTAPFQKKNSNLLFSAVKLEKL